MKILVCGGRKFTGIIHLHKVLDAILREHAITVLIEGNCRGADQLAGAWARTNRIENRKFPADWATYGKAAGMIRNKQMLDEGQPDLVIAFSGGNGTRNMAALAKERGIEVRLV